MNDWLVAACGDKPHKGVDVTKIYQIHGDTLVATDGKRIHLMISEDTSLYPEAPEVYHQVVDTCQEAEYREIDPGLWCPTECGKYVIHLFEDFVLSADYYEDIPSEATCAIGEADGPVRFCLPDRAEAYLMPIMGDLA